MTSPPKPPRAPFPYFGGKSKVASPVWAALGDPKHYIEPFFGSGAVLLARPGYDATRHMESVNDADGLLCNVWRSLQFDPDETARWADWPVNHADLCARRKVLIAREPKLTARLIEDDGFFDAKLAGYWIWAASCWIGAGLTRPNAKPNISTAGQGTHAIGKRPHLNATGAGINAFGGSKIREWFLALQSRLRRVRVVCGDWTRVCGGNWQDNRGICGMFFDPPYSKDAGRSEKIYAAESLTVAHDVRRWCIEKGAKPSYRIVLAGYYEEHAEECLAAGWRVERWSAQGGYSNQRRVNSKNQNRHKEALFFSPHCLNVEPDVFSWREQ